MSELSQGAMPAPAIDEISDKVRAAFLLHGSTASESWPAVEHLQWSIEQDEQGQPRRGGLTYDGIFLSDLFEALIAKEGIPQHIASEYPGLSPERYQEALRFIWLVLSSVQWFACLASVKNETDDRTQGDELLAGYIQKLHHFRKHPEHFR